MNSERINQLVEQCGFYVTEKNGQQLYSLIELVVRECCSISDEVERTDQPVLASKFIKAHFGIE
jgi:hypothetical protein